MSGIESWVVSKFDDGGPSVCEMKARQVAKLKEIGEALKVEGCLGLSDQARALGLTRSTAWTIVSASHKGSGLSAAILLRLLSATQQYPHVHKKILEYINEKKQGFYGTSPSRLRCFVRAMEAPPDQVEVSRPTQPNMKAVKGNT